MLTVVLVGTERGRNSNVPLLVPENTVTNGPKPTTLGSLLKTFTRASSNAGQVENGTAPLMVMVPVARMPLLSAFGFNVNALNVGPPARLTKIYWRSSPDAVDASTKLS